MTDTSPTPASLTAARRRILVEMDAEAFKLWQHNPVTAAFFQYLLDLVDDFRATAADLLENGLYEVHAQHPDKNPDVVRGRILTLRDLHQITLEDIQGLYGVVPISEDERQED